MSRWFGEKILLGKGIIKICGTVEVKSIIETIEDFGISMDKLDDIKTNYDKLFEIYCAIRAYRMSVKFLKQLKISMSGS